MQSCAWRKAAWLLVAELPWQNTPYPYHSAQNQHWKGKVNIRCRVGYQPPYPNSQERKQPFGSRGSLSDSQEYVGWLFGFSLLVIKKLQLQQAAVSPHQLAVCPPPWEEDMQLWHANVTCSMLHAAKQDRDPSLQAPTAQYRSAYHTGHAPLVSHGCSQLNPAWLHTPVSQ